MLFLDSNRDLEIPEFDIRLKDEKFPEVMVDGHWSPICGHWFWDNNYGATLFCQKLNSTYTYGIVNKTEIPLASDGIKVGKCTSQDTSLSSCTGGCNDLQVGGECSDDANSKCSVGQGAIVEIECFGSGMYV